jgi:DNA-binding beta-propeller fold protein YncE
MGTTAPPPEPLGAQTKILRSDDGRFLFATNARSNQVSVLAIHGASLKPIAVSYTGGTLAQDPAITPANDPAAFGFAFCGCK